MSQASDAVAEAVVRTQRLAAARMVRRQELEEELTRRRADRASLEPLGDGAEVQALRADLDVRVQTLTTEISAVDVELAAARRELAELGKLKSTSSVAAARAQVADALAPADPILRSPEEQALDNVRAHIADLEAQARVGADLAGTSTPAAPSEPDAPPARPKKTL